MIDLRPMSEDDVEWVVALDGKTEWTPHWPETVYREYLRDAEPGVALRRFALVAELDGERAGVALGRLLLDGVENAGELEWIAVEALSRRHGVGRALLEGVGAWFGKNGGLRLMLEVRSGNITAQRFYRKSGWVETGRRREYYRDPVEDAVLMEQVAGCEAGSGGKVSVERD